jgi:hypothetical protein
MCENGLKYFPFSSSMKVDAGSEENGEMFPPFSPM